MRHATFNPRFSNLDMLCQQQQAEGFGLVRVVPVTEYEAVAVFERRSSNGSQPKCDGCDQPMKPDWIFCPGCGLVPRGRGSDDGS